MYVCVCVCVSVCRGIYLAPEVLDEIMYKFDSNKNGEHAACLHAQYVCVYVCV